MARSDLLVLADYLDKVHEDTFNFRTITRSSDLEQLANMCKINKGIPIPEGACRTQACAIGHMPCIWPNKFKWIIDPDCPLYYNARVVDLDEFDYSSGTEPSEDFFEIDDDEWNMLFSPGYVLDSDATAKMVADNIRAFVAHDGHYSSVQWPHVQMGSVYNY